MKIIYMDVTVALLGDEKAAVLIPKGVIKKLESLVRYLVIETD